MSTDFIPLEAGEPRESRAGGIRGGSQKTRFYREQLQANPGKWFIWKKDGKHASDTSGALRTLLGLKTIAGLDRTALDYESTAQKQDDGSYTTYVRFTGNGVEDNFTALEEREEAVEVASASTGTVTTNPFGVN